MQDGFIKVAAATPKIKVADTAYNTRQIIDAVFEAQKKGVKVLVLPELCITGYTCGDLFLQRKLLESAEECLMEIAQKTAETDMLFFVGLPFAVSGKLYNCAAALCSGEILALIPKTNIPNYGEFYEKRHFTPWDDSQPVTDVEIGGGRAYFGTKLLFPCDCVRELSVAAEICEDLWVPNPPSVGHAMAGATVIVNLSASDEIVTKDEYRRELVSGQSARLVCGYLYSNAGEGESTQDLVYTGHNLICENGSVLVEERESCHGMIVTELDVQRLDADRRKMGTFNSKEEYVSVFWSTSLEETVLTREIARNPFVPGNPALRKARCEKIIALQSLGLKKRIEHAGAKKVVVGVSGGLDSTLAMLVCAKAMDMLGRDRSDILAITMPCFGTTKRTRSNAELLAEKLGAELRCVDITAAVRQHFADIGHSEDDLSVVFENCQARERTQVLMDVANGCGGLVIGTGDLSELALGWATYNADHMSMYGVNAGVPKTLVRHLTKYYADTCGDEALQQVLESILATPVSPELLPAENGEISQKTEDLVGPYELHDFYLYYAVRLGYCPAKVYRLAMHVFEKEYGKETVLKWLRTFYRRFFSQQFKRSCLPDGPKVGSLTLSPRGDWRMPSDACAQIWLQELENL